jgi:hypothetical protein
MINDLREIFASPLLSNALPDLSVFNITAQADAGTDRCTVLHQTLIFSGEVGARAAWDKFVAKVSFVLFINSLLTPDSDRILEFALPSGWPEGRAIF